MEIFRNIHQISSSIADRHLHQYLFVGDNLILLDTGMHGTPKEVIVPYLKSCGIDPHRLTIAINTHADADHHGGNASLKEIAGNVALACGEMDRVVIENPDRLFAVRYNQWIDLHGVGLANMPEAADWVRSMAGPPHRIDRTFRGGEVLELDGRRTLRVLHVPGHSNGHLAIYDPVEKTVFVGDALHGNFCPSVDGKPSLPPAYFSLLAYLCTIQLIENLEIEWVYSAHWPVYRGPGVREFLAECRAFVDKAQEQVLRALYSHPEGLSLRQCIEECGPALGDWPVNNQWLLMYPFHGHLSHLEQQGIATQIRENDRILWKPTG